MPKYHWAFLLLFCIRNPNNKVMIIPISAPSRKDNAQWYFGRAPKMIFILLKYLIEIPVVNSAAAAAAEIGDCAAFTAVCVMKNESKWRRKRRRKRRRRKGRSLWGGHALARRPKKLVS